MTEQRVELLLDNIEPMSKTLSQCIIMNNNTLTGIINLVIDEVVEFQK